jgi:hypothetical protein
MLLALAQSAQIHRTHIHRPSSRAKAAMLGDAPFYRDLQS